MDRENGKNQENEKRSHTQRNGMRSFQSITSTRTEPPPPSPPVPKPTTGKGNFRALYPPSPSRPTAQQRCDLCVPKRRMRSRVHRRLASWNTNKKDRDIFGQPHPSLPLSLSLDERHDYQADYELSLMIDTHAIFCYLLATSTTTATPPTPPPSYCNPLIGLVVVVVSVG